MNDQSSTSEIPQYSVSVWEVILIAIGALILIGLGLFGLGVKVLNNAFNPLRAEKIAHSLIEYKIPGGSQGVFGINIGVAKLAWVRSTTNPPDVVLFVGKTPVNREANKTDLLDLSENPLWKTPIRILLPPPQRQKAKSSAANCYPSLLRRGNNPSENYWTPCQLLDTLPIPNKTMLNKWSSLQQMGRTQRQ